MIQDAAPRDPFLQSGPPLQDEPVGPVIRVRVRASQSLIDDDGNGKPIGRLDGRRQGPVLLCPVVDLDPVQDKLRPAPLGKVVEPADALLGD